MVREGSQMTMRHNSLARFITVPSALLLTVSKPRPAPHRAVHSPIQYMHCQFARLQFANIDIGHYCIHGYVYHWLYKYNLNWYAHVDGYSEQTISVYIYIYIYWNTISTHLILSIHEWKMEAMKHEVAAPMNVAVPRNRDASLRDIRQCCRCLGYIIFLTPSVTRQTYTREAYRHDNRNCCNSSNTRGFNISTFEVLTFWHRSFIFKF
jgi:hypothetical protein